MVVYYWGDGRTHSGACVEGGELLSCGMRYCSLLNSVYDMASIFAAYHLEQKVHSRKDRIPSERNG